VAVRDAGAGMTAEVLEKAFESFFTTKAEGIGIGLSTSRSIVEVHNGRLWATANAKSGMTFRFCLPVYKGQGRNE